MKKAVWLILLWSSLLHANSYRFSSFIRNPDHSMTFSYPKYLKERADGDRFMHFRLTDPHPNLIPHFLAPFGSEDDGGQGFCSLVSRRFRAMHEARKLTNVYPMNSRIPVGILFHDGGFAGRCEDCDFYKEITCYDPQTLISVGKAEKLVRRLVRSENGEYENEYIIMNPRIVRGPDEYRVALHGDAERRLCALFGFSKVSTEELSTHHRVGLDYETHALLKEDGSFLSLFRSDTNQPFIREVRCGGLPAHVSTLAKGLVLYERGWAPWEMDFELRGITVRKASWLWSLF